MTRKRIHEIINKAENGDKASKVFDCVILSLIGLTIAAVVLQSFRELNALYSNWFTLFEYISIAIFTLEYLLRLWTADLSHPEHPPMKVRLKYLFSFMALVDLLAILPFYLPMIISIDLRFLRMLRLTRLFRVFKLNRYSRALNLIGKVFKEKKEELLSTVFIMLLLILISSTLIYHIESEQQPEMFPNIIASFWWAVATLTTVGYGDIYPITGAGKILASIIAITGIGLVALPTGIISSGFMDEIKKRKGHTCPHCGKTFESEE